MSSSAFIIVSVIAGFVAFVGDFVITFIIGVTASNYNPFEDTMSELGTRERPYTLIFTIWWVIWGLCLIVFSLGFLVADLYTSKGIIQTIAILISIFGFGGGIIAGLFPEDPKGVDESISGKIHGIFGGMGYLALLFVPSIMLSIVDNWLLVVSVIAQIAGILFFILFLASEGAKIAKSGLWQRLFLATYYSYLGIFAILMISKVI